MTNRKTTSNKKATSSKKAQPSPKLEDKFLIVGMGASAGGLQAFKEFFTVMPDDSGMAFVLVQHLDPTHKSLMVELLEKNTNMKVSEVKDGTKVEQNCVYVIPPNSDMAILNGVLHLMAPSKARGFRRPIDYFLRSLAEDQGERAVGIILSGTGTEGTLSLKNIKGQGGLTIVEDPETAQYDGMPRSAMTVGAEDFVLPISKMPELLLKYSKNRNLQFKEKPSAIAKKQTLLEKIFILLREETGCNFSDYKSNTVIRRIEKRMAINQIDTLENYIKHLQSDSKEVHKLFKELLIGVTSFFRDKTSFEALAEKAIPQIIKQKSEGDTIRIWVPGCSTGEEAYSIAIKFDEAIRAQNKKLKIQVFASDIDEYAIDIARLGTYPETIAADVSAERLTTYFDKSASSYQIKKEIRDLLVFAEHNLLKDPPFSKLDMVSCRNLLIYLNIEAQQRVFSIFHYALMSGGFLFLGGSESLGEYADVFEVVDRKEKIYKQKKGLSNKIPETAYNFRKPVPISKLSLYTNKRLLKDNLADVTEHFLLANYAPACAIIDSKGDAVYFSGNTGKYLQPSPGEAQLNIVEMAREGLKSDLRRVITQVRKSKKKEVRTGVKVKTNDSFQLIDLCISPLNQSISDKEHLVVTFEDRESGELNKKENQESRQKEEGDITERQALEQELTSTKEYLRSTIEQLEISNEELKSSNEELQSSNEELQSSNEELETSKEELQSVNEEVITVNSELQGKVDELAEAYDDMSNLLASTDIGTIFLDSKLNIKRFTPSMSRIINLIQTDVGRPVQHLSSNLNYDGLVKDIKRVLEKLTPLGKPVKSKDGVWYKMQIMPYRTSQNVIEGVVITFFDITEQTKQAEELKQFKENYEYLLANTKTTVYTQDKNLVYTGVGNQYPSVHFQNMVGKTDQELFNKKEAATLLKLKKSVLATGKTIRKTIPLTFAEELQYHDLTVRAVYKDSSMSGIACTSTDVSELIQTKGQLGKLKIETDGGKLRKK